MKLPFDLLMAFAGIGGDAYKRHVLRRLVITVTMLAVFTIITAMILGGLIVGAFYAAGISSLQTAPDPQAALTVIGMIAAGLMAVFASAALYCLHRLRHLTRGLTRSSSPIVGRAQDVVDAFVDGLLARDTHHYKKGSL